MAATHSIAATAARLPPRMGGKQIYLPNFTLTLIRPPPSTASPKFATFLVPLSLNKLDLRDYLFNMYRVRVSSVRSYIQQQKIRQDRPGAKRPSPRQWYRPRAIKKMMVELERPFVWPDFPDGETFDRWDKETHDAARRENERFQEGRGRDAKMRPRVGERKVLAREARGLVEGREVWKGGVGLGMDGEDGGGEGAVWEDVGEAVEVETEVELPKN